MPGLAGNVRLAKSLRSQYPSPSTACGCSAFKLAKQRPRLLVFQLSNTRIHACGGCCASGDSSLRGCRPVQCCRSTTVAPKCNHASHIGPVAVDGSSTRCVRHLLFVCGEVKPAFIVTVGCFDHRRQHMLLLNRLTGPLLKI